MNEQVEIWLSFAADYPKEDQLNILLVLSYLDKVAPGRGISDCDACRWAAGNIFKLPRNSQAYIFLRRIDELDVEPADLIEPIRAMVLDH